MSDSGFQEFIFADANGNQVSMIAPSKSAAKRRLQKTYLGWNLRFVEAKPAAAPERRRKVPLPGVMDAASPSRPKVMRKRKAYGRNDRCPCGAMGLDGRPKKVKHCCGAADRNTSNAPKA